MPCKASGHASAGGPEPRPDPEHATRDGQWYLCPTAARFSDEVNHLLEEADACQLQQTLEIDILVGLHLPADATVQICPGA